MQTSTSFSLLVYRSCMSGFAHKLYVHGCRYLNSIKVNVCVVTCEAASSLLISPPILGVRVHGAYHDLQECRRWREIWEQPVSMFHQGLKLMPVVCHLHTDSLSVSHLQSVALVWGCATTYRHQ